MILISNNSELAAKYYTNEVDQSKTTLEISNINNGFFQEIDIKKEEKSLVTQSMLNMKLHPIDTKYRMFNLSNSSSTLL